MAKILWNDTLRHKILQMAGEGKTHKEIRAETEIPETTQRYFLSRFGKLHEDFWKQYDLDSQDILSNIAAAKAEINEEQLAQVQFTNDELLVPMAKSLRRTRNKTTQLQRQANQLLDISNYADDIKNALIEALKQEAIQRPRVEIPYSVNTTTEPCTWEVLLSDLQIGKITENYNTEVAIAKLEDYGNQVCERILNDQSNYCERIILGCLGDNVEDHLKHGVNSAISTDSTLGVQIANAFTYIYLYVIAKLAAITPQLDVICVAGNHGSSSHKGMDTFMAGKSGYDWPIYVALEHLCKAAKLNNVSFYTPEGIYAHTSIYGRIAVYEHGYFNDCSEKSMEGMRSKRSNQLRQYVHYFRNGDKHHLSNYDNGRLLSSPAFFGDDIIGSDYSGALGYSAQTGQIMIKHTPEDRANKSTIREVVFISL